MQNSSADHDEARFLRLNRDIRAAQWFRMQSGRDKWHQFLEAARLWQHIRGDNADDAEEATHIRRHMLHCTICGSKRHRETWCPFKDAATQETRQTTPNAARAGNIRHHWPLDGKFRGYICSARFALKRIRK